MTVAANASPLERAVTGELSEIVGMILDKGLVIDAFVRVSLVGIEVLTVDAKVVVASIDTYLRYAEAVARLESQRPAAPQTLPNIVQGVAEGVTKGALDAVQQTVAAVPAPPPAAVPAPPPVAVPAAPPPAAVPAAPAGAVPAVPVPAPSAAVPAAQPAQGSAVPGTEGQP